MDQRINKQLIKNTSNWEIDAKINKNHDYYFEKEHGNAFTNNDLVQFIKEQSIIEITVGGLVSHGCVQHTCMGGIEIGFDMFLLHDGHTCWNKDAKEKIENTENALKKLGVKIV